MAGVRALLPSLIAGRLGDHHVYAHLHTEVDEGITRRGDILLVGIL